MATARRIIVRRGPVKEALGVGGEGQAWSSPAGGGDEEGVRGTMSWAAMGCGRL